MRATVILILLVGPTGYAYAYDQAYDQAYEQAYDQPCGCFFSYMLQKFVHQTKSFFGNEDEMRSIKNLQQKLQKNVNEKFTKKVLSRIPKFVPKAPRRPIIMVWPSIMDPAISKVISNKSVHTEYGNEEYLEVQCDRSTNEEVQRFNRTEILEGLDPWEEEDRAPDFFFDLVPEWIVWMSKQVIECGFFTIFANERHQIYRFIDSNRSNWVKALQELTYILLQVIAVIHNKTNAFQDGNNWLENWLESYEIWHTNYETPEKYLQDIVTNSFDIVTAWLYDYIAQRTKSKYSNWDLSNDDEIVCALENYDLVPALSWDYLLDQEDDKMRIMAATYMKCEILAGCDYRRPIEILIATNGSDTIVRIPKPEDCRLNCTALPENLGFQTYPHDDTLYRRMAYAAYAHAHMYTEAGFDVHCSLNIASTRNNKIILKCQPQVIEKIDRQYRICKAEKCEKNCCKPIKYRSPAHCETVTDSFPKNKLKNITKITITEAYPNKQ